MVVIHEETCPFGSYSCGRDECFSLLTANRHPGTLFGIDQLVTMYSGQTYTFTDGRGAIVYPDAGNGPYTHYVDKNAPGATDTSNTFGSPSKPRLTIPSTPTPHANANSHAIAHANADGYA